LNKPIGSGEKPVTPTIVQATLAPDMHELEPTLTRYGYNAKALSELLHIRQAEVRSFLPDSCRRARGRTAQPVVGCRYSLGDHLASGSNDLLTG